MVKTVTQVDFVVVIDHSASMKMNNKLAFVQATIEYLISKLNEAHRFCLIKFNQDVSLVTNGLLPMTNDNKEKVRALLHGILNLIP
jgi:Mg-chelatase subunit ChlD